MNKMMLPLIAIVALVLGAGGAFVLLGGKKSAEPHEEKKVPPQLHMMEERTVNLADPPHYLKVTLGLEVVSEHGEAQGGGGHGEKKDEEAGPLAEYTPKLMDKLIEICSKQTYSHLLESKGKKHLKEELIEGFNEVLEEEGWTVKEVLFTDFVME